MLNLIRISIFSFFLILYGVVHVVTTHKKDQQIKLILDQQVENLDHNYKVTTNRFKLLSDSLYAVVVNQTDIIELLYKAKHSKTEDERTVLRKNLYTKMRPYFEGMKAAGLNIMLFSFEDNKCFLRVHKPNKYNDDLSSVRYSFTYVNDKKKIVRGFEQGKIAHAFRNVFPIYHDDEYLGSVDFSFSSEVFQENMTSLHGIDTHFILNKMLFDVNLWQAKDKVKYIQSIEHEDFLFATTPAQSDNVFTSKKLKLNAALREEIHQNIKHGGSFSLYHDNGNVQIIAFSPVKNIKDNMTVAYLVSYADSYYIKQLLNQYTLVNALSLIGALILAFLLSNNVKHRLYLEARVADEVEKNKKQQENMLVQSRMAQMGEMLSMIAHQWRQPLASISATISSMMVRQELGKYDPEYFNEQLNKIADYTQHLSGTINDFREFFKEDKIKMESTFEKIVTDSLHIIGPIIEGQGIKILTDYQCNEKLLVYPNELKQVVLNLLKNSQEAIEEKKTDNAKIEIQTYKDGMNYYLLIRDNAGGIPEGIMNRIFEPYFTTKGNLNGTGLGLYMSNLIITEHHKGRLTVSNQDDGACFIIELSGSLKE
jgi:signal transduction histidine kinase